MEEPIYLSLDTDYLGFLGGQLRNLKGYATLANELIQNADDAGADVLEHHATWITFDVHDDALIVTNNGWFSDCGAVDQSDQCPWKGKRDGRMCDFHRFRQTAAGNKRREAGTTGAFGIGFISVYQITDRPELASGRRHWVISPEKDSAHRVAQYSLSEEDMVLGTQFRFPWARDPQSEMREVLQSESLGETDIETLLREIHDALPNVVLFLKNLTRLELKRNGQPVRIIECLREQDHIVVQDGDKMRFWCLLRGGFSQEAQQLRQRYGSNIEPKRHSDVLVALPDDMDAFQGVLCATLPTQQQTGLPFHINADFFPTPDRKSVVEGNDYQAAWNEAALRAAARAVAQFLPRLTQHLGHKTFWNSVSQIEAVQRAVAQSRLIPVYDEFWDLLRPQLIQADCVYTTEEQWQRPNATVQLPEQSYQFSQLSLLKEVGFHVIHLDLRRHHNILLNLGAASLSVQSFAASLLVAGLVHAMPLADAPAWIRPAQARSTLADLIVALASKLTMQDRMSLAGCAIAISTDGWLCSPHDLWNASNTLIQMLDPFGLGYRYIAIDNPDPVSELVIPLIEEEILRALATLPPETFHSLWQEQPESLVNLIAWFADRSAETWRSALREQLRALPLWPSGGTTRPLTELHVPGDFTDPLCLADLMDDQIVRHHQAFLCDTLQANPLSLQRYVRDALPAALASEKTISDESRHELVRLLAENLGKIREDTFAAAALAKYPLVFAGDGAFHPATQTYFQTDLVQSVLGETGCYVKFPVQAVESTRDLFRWLGVSEKPRATDIVRQVDRLTQFPPTDATRGSLQRLLVSLGSHWAAFRAQEAQLVELKQRPWLPSDRIRNRWFRPSEIYASYQRYLFETQVDFIDLPVNSQGLSREFFSFLEIKSEPTTQQVVSHLMECVRTAKPPNLEVYTVLQRATENFVDRGILETLKRTPCLWLDGIGFARPDEVFWAENPFGSYAYLLGSDFQRFRVLLTWLGVREHPNADDALRLLIRLGDRHRKTHSPLDEQDQSVITQCWSLLQNGLDQNSDLASELKALHGQEVVLDDRGMLQRPEWMYFVDRPNIAARFGEPLAHNIVERHRFTWRALEAAGVRPLSRSVQSQLVECEGEQEDEGLTARLQQRRPLVQRVLDAQHVHEGQSWDIELLPKIRLYRAVHLQVVHTVVIVRHPVNAPAEVMPAYYNAADHRLYFQHATGEPWAAIAREIAGALNPEIEPSLLSSPLMQVLSVPTEAEAHAILDELGFAPLELSEIIPPESAEPARLGLDGQFPVAEVSEEAEEAADPGTTYAIAPNRVSETSNGVSWDHKGGAQGGNGEDRSGVMASAPIGPKVDSAGTTGAEYGDTIGYKGAAASPATFAPNPATQGGRLYSYVSQDKEQSPGSIGATEHRQRVEQAGIGRVLAYEASWDRIPAEMPFGNPGYDIESRGVDGELIRYIEVKSIPVTWGDKGVGLSETQFRKAQEFGDRYWLYVVEDAEADDYRITRIQDPAFRVTRFYFDHMWRDAGEADETA